MTAYRDKDRGKVVLISVDGLRAEFYLSDRFAAPTLQRLAREGAFADSAEPIFPSLTYPVHTALVTGKRSAAHGVYSNTVFKEGVTPAWYWYEKTIRVPTLWQAAKAAGRSTAIIRWPASVGAKADWFVPEIFNSPGYDFALDWKLIRKHTRPELFKDLVDHSLVKEIRSTKDIDQFTTDSVVRILATQSPDLMLVHLIQVDFSQHATGRESEATRKAVAEMDRALGRIVAAIERHGWEDTTLVVAGDHGFVDYDRILHLNFLFKNKGWIDENGERWKVIAHGEGGQASVYVRDASVIPSVRALLEEFAPDRFEILDSKQLAEWGAYPEAAFAVSAKPGFAFDSNWAVDVWESKLMKPKSSHGHLPVLSEVQTGFIAYGAKVKPGLRLGKIRVLDVASTVAELLGIPFPKTDGAPIPLH